jgi:nicotinamide-nucleotide adenylyltransferase
MHSQLGFYLGRFQPYSLKHLEITQRILEEYPHILLNIGVAGWRGDKTRDNFLTGEEAARVVNLSLKDFSLEDRVGITIVELQPKLTVEESIRSILPENLPVLFFSGSSKTLGVLERLKNEGRPLDIRALPDDDLTPPRSREIRDSLLSGTDNWRGMVTSSVYEYLPQFRGRLMSLPEGSLKRPWQTEADLNSGSERR